jgi:hypothetical protein
MEILTAIIGGLFSLLAVLLTYYLNKREGSHEPAYRRPANTSAELPAHLRSNVVGLAQTARYLGQNAPRWRWGGLAVLAAWS